MSARARFRFEMVPQTLRRRIGFVLGRLALLIRQGSAASLASLGLTMKSYAILCCLAEYGSCSQQGIAARIGIDPSDLVPLLQTLVEQGVISQEPDDADGRRDSVEITGRGRRLVLQATTILDALEDELLRALSMHERDNVCALAARVLMNQTSVPAAPRD